MPRRRGSALEKQRHTPAVTGFVDGRGIGAPRKLSIGMVSDLRRRGQLVWNDAPIRETSGSIQKQFSQALSLGTRTAIYPVAADFPARQRLAAQWSSSFLAMSE